LLLTVHNVSFSEKLLHWYAIHKRDLPWRNSRNPYKIWLSEIILQQTRVAQGLPYYLEFTQKFPTIKTLADAEEDLVLRTWQGLGYYSRARNLHKCAKIICSHHGGFFPDSYQELIKLPGIGPYTAAAIASFAFDKPHAVVDGNVYRVLARIFGVEDDIASGKGQRTFTTLANELIPQNDPGTYNQAIMEFGAVQCTPVNPACDQCPFQTDCHAYKHDMQSILPIKSKKKPARKRYFHYAVLRTNTSLCMKPRTEKDIWQGLYDFPLIETSAPLAEEEALEELFAAFTLPKDCVVDSVSTEYRHILSHQHLITKFYLIDLPHEKNGLSDPFIRPFPEEQILDLPKPVLISRYLNDYIF
jgi:A/G-specific adenine glycosylase